jgi:hypothetical protein
MTIAASALFITSATVGIINLILTLTVRRMYPRDATAVTVFDAMLILSACSLWAVVLTATKENYNFDGAFLRNLHNGPGFWIFWAAASAKLAVTPALMMKQIDGVCGCSKLLCGSVQGYERCCSAEREGGSVL